MKQCLFNNICFFLVAEEWVKIFRKIGNANNPLYASLLFYFFKMTIHVHGLISGYYLKALERSNWGQNIYLSKGDVTTNSIRLNNPLVWTCLRKLSTWFNKRHKTWEDYTRRKSNFIFKEVLSFPTCCQPSGVTFASKYLGDMYAL